MYRYKLSSFILEFLEPLEEYGTNGPVTFFAYIQG